MKTFSFFVFSLKESKQKIEKNFLPLVKDENK
jgi:hypothetical protein